MLKTRLRRGAKWARGLLYTYVRPRGAYDANQYWDDEFYSTGVSDAQTLASADIYSEATTRYHYSSIEMNLHRMCVEDDYSFQGKSVLDVGAGSGHWTDFYLRQGAASVTAIDLSQKSCEAIEKRFQDFANVTVTNCSAMDVVGEFDLVHAVGVMFHITDDSDWAATVQHLENISEKMVVGGSFGRVTLNYSWAHRKYAMKRLRSLSSWRGIVSGNMRVLRNPAWSKIDQTLPHSNLLIIN